MNINTTSNKIRISNFLLQPYPFYYKGKELVIISSLLFIMSLFFNYFFEPFEVYVPEHKMDFFWISFIHAIIPINILLILSLFLKVANAEENWIIRKEIFFVFIFMLAVGFVQFLIRDIIYDNADNWSLRYLFEEIRNTFLVGILFVTILVPLNFNRLYSKNTNNANVLNDSYNLIKQIENPKIIVNTKIESENFQLDISSFLFAKADGNYVELYLQVEKINKILKRITIKELELVLKPYSNIIKTHRSFLVNLHHIENITGNAQGYKLRLKDVDEVIPVSRNMITNFNARVKR